MIKAVIFDIDGVLLDSQTANTKYIQEYITSEGYPTPSVEQTTQYKHLGIRDMIRQFTKETDEHKILAMWERAIIFPYDESLLKIPSDAHETIEKLKQTYKLGIVTNRLINHIDHFFKMYGSAEDFDVVVTLSDIKNPKPDPEPMLLAIEKLGIAPNETVYIGDSLSDLQSAKSAGAKCIMYQATEIKGADLYSESFAELPEAIKKLS